MAGEQDTEFWQSTIAAMDAPVAITKGEGDGLRLIGHSTTMLEVFSADANGLADRLRDFDIAAAMKGPTPIPGKAQWLLKARPVSGSGCTLWQAARRSAETTTERIAEWVATASLGDMALFFFDPEGRLRAYSRGVRNYFPLSPGFPVIGEPFREQLDAIVRTYDFDSLKGNTEPWIEDLMDGYLNPGQIKVGPTPAGRWALTTTTVMGDGSRIQVMNDVTDFRERDQQLKLYMRNAQGILFSRRELKPDGQLQVWGDKRAMQSENPTSPEGYSGTEGWFQLIDERDRQWYIDFMLAIEPGSAPYSIEVRSRVAGSDKVRWTREIGWTVQDRMGNHYLDAIYFDITSTKNAAHALTESTERFRQFADMASDWYFELDADLNLVFLSDRYESVSGQQNTDLTGRNYEEIVKFRASGLGAEKAAPWQQILEMWRNRQPVHDHQMQFLNADGELRTIWASSRPRFDKQGNFLGHRGIGRDMTQLALAQSQSMEALARAEQANETKSAFIANVSHELRTPLNAILGFSSVMADELLGPMSDERYRRYAADIHQSGTHLLSLVNDLLDISRVEAGSYSIDDEDIDLADEVIRVFSLVELQAGARNMVNACGRELPILRADRRAIRQILINIVANAVKFTDEDGTVRIGASLRPDGQLTLSIEDDGAGIAAGELERVLEPFGRAKTQIAAEGTGLGLPLSRNLVELHGGVLDIVSHVGKGTRVEMTFPPERVLPRLQSLSATG